MSASPADLAAIDPETRALLDELGVDPAAYLKRQAEIAAFKMTPEEEAKLRAEQAQYRGVAESTNEFLDEHGLWSDGLRPW